MCCKCCTVQQQMYWAYGAGGILSVIGVVLISASPAIVTSIVESQLPLSPGSIVYNKWVTSPVPIFISFYLFNWTNPQEAGNVDVKPHFEQIGPFTFRDYKVKENLDWNNVNSTVTFYGRRTFVLVPELTNGSLDAPITCPHFPTIGAAKLVRPYRNIIRRIVNFALNREGGFLYATHPAIEWIFDGFNDYFLDFVERLHSPLFPIYTPYFAWFYERNNSKEAEGTFTVHTGQKDLSQMGDLKLWNGSDHTGYWQGECGRVNGSTGELWAPRKTFDENVSIFISDVARFLNIFPREKVEYRGIKAWRYESTNQSFDSGYIAPDTACFCTKREPCPPNGAVDFSPVTYGVPIYISHPHFYLADPSFLENTTGLSPSMSDHIFNLVMEPTLGVPLSLQGQVMLSVLVERDESFDLLKDLAWNFYAPLVSIRIHTEISDELFRSIKLVLKLGAIGQYTGIGVLVIGVALISTGIWLQRSQKLHGNQGK